MAYTDVVDNAKVVLILGNFVGADDILSWSDNARFQFNPSMNATGTSWKGGEIDEQELKQLFLCLRIGENLFDPAGWVLGSHDDSDICDIQIATTNQTGISRQACRIDISPQTHRPRVTRLSDRRIRIHGRSTITLKQGLPQELIGPVTIDLGAVTLRGWVPARTATETAQYKERARSYSKDIMGSLPKRLPSILSYDETSAEYVRYGTNNAVYVVEGSGIRGKGAHASVMKVKNVSTGEFFGAKEPYYKTSDNADTARKRFEALRAEYNHIKRLDHPHIVKAFDLVVAEDITLSPWMIVEYLPLNLGEALPGLDKSERLIAMTYLSSALAYMYTSGVNHRDLKLDNALVIKRQRELIVKLADFSTLKQNESAKMDTFTGTEIYMAPELFNKPRLYINKIDMWALGLIGMQLFTNWEPETDEQWDPNDFRTWVCNVAIPEIAEAPEFLQPMIKGLLRKNPVRRWSPWKCLKWLWKYEATDSPDETFKSGTDTTINRKRPASRDLQLLQGADDDRHRRSPNPTLSTTRIQSFVFQEDKSLPDTASPSSRLPDVPVPSTASTPRIDDTTLDLNQQEDDESSGADTDLEEWQY
ncbi:Calcium/calmodulin-dependent protein kinase type IV [Metarhizium guizhouense ARSEF 977]|uniref:Calcium/calmodulin-dependent protein kinase type IV n=1 Tax=Metarhizium guizhouense (strain ARSEF 977) TaxID=1276136 RepID=A0A0B4GYT0_METGA|nr:Calcium/calmodulin-dependent protein kinase type IV [Metarhizium guizhouense ARSEF 977]